MSVAVNPGADILEQHREDERRRALRALLARPMLTGGPEFVAARRHGDALRAWFQREAGWHLDVQRDCVRLYKRPANLHDATRGASGFTRRRYVLLCLVAAALEGAGAQLTLRSLGERLPELAADEALARAGFGFTLERIQDRRDLVHVCRFLLDLGALRRVAGDEEAYVRQAGDALYDIRREVLSRLLACARGPSTWGEEEPRALDARLDALVDELELDSDTSRRLAERHHVARRLLDDPVVYFDELDAGPRAYLTNQRGPLGARLGEAAGLVAEQRAEGMALIDADGELTDERLPGEGTLAHATLLVAGYLTSRVDESGPAPVSRAGIEAHLREAAREYGRFWRKQAREPGAERELARDALSVLEGLRLVERRDDGIVPLPALARFAPGTPQLKQASLVSR